MKMIYTPGQAPTFEVEITGGKQAFEILAKVSELFSETQCGCCGSVNIRPQVREIEAGAYYEYVCMECTAQLSFGQKKDNKTLWAKRWDKELNAPMPNRGWYIYHKDTSRERAPASGSQGGQSPPADEDIPF